MLLPVQRLFERKTEVVVQCSCTRMNAHRGFIWSLLLSWSTHPGRPHSDDPHGSGGCTAARCAAATHSLPHTPHDPRCWRSSTLSAWHCPTSERSVPTRRAAAPVEPPLQINKCPAPPAPAAVLHAVGSHGSSSQAGLPGTLEEPHQLRAHHLQGGAHQTPGRCVLPCALEHVLQRWRVWRSCFLSAASPACLSPPSGPPFSALHPLRASHRPSAPPPPPHTQVLRLGAPSVLSNGDAFWLEGRPAEAGRSVLVQR
jgi:hypothetical protein